MKVLVLSCGWGYCSFGVSFYGYVLYLSCWSKKIFLKDEFVVLVWFVDVWESWCRRIIMVMINFGLEVGNICLDIWVILK